MSYQALYRVWRPQIFADVIGQTHITQTLQNALREGSPSHAYLFSGPRGTGKTSTAKIMAQTVNCDHAPVAEPCLECPSCTGIQEGTVVDIIEIDAASNNGVDEIRDLRDKVKFAPTEVNMKVYIIDEVHMLSQGAFNALLKTLEEPPDHVMFILATTEPHKIPLTIVSRCQRFDFRRISKQAMLERLTYIIEQEEISIEEEAIQLLIRVAEGGMRDLLSLLDQAVAYAEETITVEDCLAVTGSVSSDALSHLADAILTRQVEEAIRFVDVLMDEGKEPVRLVEDLIYYYRDVLLYQTSPHLEDVLARVQMTEQMQEQIEHYSKETLFTTIERLSTAQQDMKWSQHPRVFLEVAIIQLMQAASQSQAVEKQTVSPSVIDQLEKRMKDMEAQLSDLLRKGNVHTGTGNVKDEEKSSPASRGVVSHGASRTGSVQSKIAQPPVSSTRVKEMLQSASKPLLVQLDQQWAAVLDEIKKQKITVHAWLRDARPVACSEDAFLLAFNSAIHRETTEKDSHRQLIEDVVGRALQSKAKMMTIMDNEWNEIKEDFIREQKGGEEEPQENQSDPIYDEAVQLVGEDLVEVIDK